MLVLLSLFLNLRRRCKKLTTDKEEEFKESFNNIVSEAHFRLVMDINKNFEKWGFDAAYFDLDAQTIFKIDKETFSRRTEEPGMDRE